MRLIRISMLIEPDEVRLTEAGHTVSADTSHPLDSNAIADLYIRSLCARSKLHHLANALVATNLTWLSWCWQPAPLEKFLSLLCLPNVKYRIIERTRWVGSYWRDVLIES